MKRKNLKECGEQYRLSSPFLNILATDTQAIYTGYADEKSQSAKCLADKTRIKSSRSTSQKDLTNKDPPVERGVFQFRVKP